MLVLIWVTPPPTTTTRRLRWQFTEADGRSHKNGHFWRQRQNSNSNNMPTTTTSMTRRQSQYANNYNKTPTTTTTVRRQTDNVAIIDKRLTKKFSLTISKKIKLCNTLSKFVCYSLSAKQLCSKNKTNKQIQYLWERKLTALFFITPIHHITIHHLYIAQLVSFYQNRTK